MPATPAEAAPAWVRYRRCTCFTSPDARGPRTTSTRPRNEAPQTSAPGLESCTTSVARGSRSRLLTFRLREDAARTTSADRAASHIGTTWRRSVRIERREHPHEPGFEQFAHERVLQHRRTAQDPARIRGSLARLHRLVDTTPRRLLREMRATRSRPALHGFFLEAQRGRPCRGRRRWDTARGSSPRQGRSAWRSRRSTVSCSRRSPPRSPARCCNPATTATTTARSVHNGLIDRRPALIARCHGTADIADAIATARSSGLEISVRGGGHNVAGRAVADGGLMIDVSPMKGIHVDPAARTLRAQGGVRLEGAQPRGARSRARRDRRRDLLHRHRRLHAGRRARLADGEVWPRRRQPDRRGARDRRRRDPERRRREPPRPDVGAPRRRRQLRRGAPRSSTVCTR